MCISSTLVKLRSVLIIDVKVCIKDLWGSLRHWGRASRSFFFSVVYLCKVGLFSQTSLPACMLELTGNVYLKPDIKRDLYKDRIRQIFPFIFWMKCLVKIKYHWYEHTISFWDQCIKSKCWSVWCPFSEEFEKLVLCSWSGTCLVCVCS